MEIDDGPFKPLPPPPKEGVEAIELLPVPGEGRIGYLEALIHNTAAAFVQFQSDAMSLDWCEVFGVWRGRVLSSKEYQRATRKSRAERYLNEINEAERLCKELMGTDVQKADPRVPGSRKQMEKDQKDLFQMRLKAQELRRELLNLSRAKEEEETAEQLLIMFVPITRAEWEALEQTEVFLGSEQGGFEAEAEKVAGISVNGVSKKVMEEINEQQTKDIEGGYRTNVDGSVEDFKKRGVRVRS